MFSFKRGASSYIFIKFFIVLVIFSKTKHEDNEDNVTDFACLPNLLKSIYQTDASVRLVFVLIALFIHISRNEHLSPSFISTVNEFLLLT